MFRFVVLMSALCLGITYAQQPDINTVISDLIKSLDDYIQQKNMSEIKINNIDYDFGIASIDIEGGSVKNLSSIQLSGDKVSVKNTSAGTTVSFGVGFDVLELHFGMVKINSLLVDIDDDITIQARQNSLSVQLTFKQNQDTCDVTVSQAQTNLGDFDVTLKQFGDDSASFFDNMVGFFVEKVLNMFASDVESFLNPQLQQTLNSALSSMDLSKMNLCQMV